MTGAVETQPAPVVLRVDDVGRGAVEALLTRYGIEPVGLAAGSSIPGSYWGESEAGLIGSRLYWRPDTPVHSILHEASHFICMTEPRRAQLDRDAGGDHDEENAVCYLQILLADELGAGTSRESMGRGTNRESMGRGTNRESMGRGTNRESMCRDMDAWGYTFRLGSAQAWFERDAQDARAWLERHGLIDAAGRVTWRKRET